MQLLCAQVEAAVLASSLTSSLPPKATRFFFDMKPPPHQPPFRHGVFKKIKAKKGAQFARNFFFSEIKSNQITPNRTKKRKFRHKLKPEQIGGSYSFFINLSEEQNMFSLEK